MRRVIWNPWQSNEELKFKKNQALELHSPLPKSFKVCKERSKEKGKNRVKKTEDKQLQSSWALLEHFPKSIFYILYIISKLRKSRIQCFKWCAIRSWNEGVKAIASRSLQAEERILHSVAKSPFCCEMISQPFCTVHGCSPEASRYLWLTLLDIFLQIFVSKFPFSPCIQPLM